MRRRFSAFHNLLKNIVRECARATVHWLLIMCLFIPSMPALAESAQTVDATNDAAETLDGKMVRLRDLVAKIAAPAAGSKENVSARTEAHRLAMNISDEISKSIAPLEEKIKASRKTQSAADTAEPATAVDETYVHLKKMRRELWTLTGKGGLAFEGRFLLDPNGAIDPSNIGNAEVIPRLASQEEVQRENPAAISQTLKAWGAAGYSGIKSFSVQYATFSVAMGFMALAQLGAQRNGYVETTDPAALERWEQQTFNLLGAVGFGFFMMANHPVVNAYKNLRELKALKIIPDSVLGGFLMNLGMTAGMFAQSAFQDIWNDKDVWQCVRPYYNSRATPVKDACAKMRANLLNSGKSMQYLPGILSMIAATPLATVARQAIVASGVLRPASSLVNRVQLKLLGGALIHKSKLSALALKGAQIVPGAFIAVGDFVLFLAISAKVTDEIAHDFVQNVAQNYVDPVAWMAKKLDLHTDFFWPTDNGYQPFANALEVEATNAYSAHSYLMDFYRQMQANGWREPAPVSACVPKDIAEEAKKADPEAAKQNWLFQNWWQRSSRKKSQRQLSCEVFAHPFELLERYGKVNRDWRTVIMNPFATSVNNWSEMISQFTTVMNASYTLGEKLSDAKHAVLYKQQAPPNLSREALAKLIGTELPGDDANAEQPHRVHSAFLDGSWVPTPELVDYIVAGFACGPDAKLDPNAIETGILPRFFSNVYSFFARQIQSESYMTTPWGSSTHFIPVKLTNKNRAICENIPLDSYSAVNYMLGNPFPDLTGKPVQNPFSGPFKDDGGQSYQTLADYVFANISPEISKPTGDASSFRFWWSQKIRIPMLPVWANYNKVYDSFIKNKYLPKLFDRSFRGGCRFAQEITKHSAKTAPSEFEGFNSIPFQAADAPGSKAACSSSTAYRVSNGYFLAIEVELRNYLRGLYSLYTSAFDKFQVPADAKAEFMQLAGSLIKAVQIVDANIIQSSDFETVLKQMDEDLNTLTELVGSRLKAKPSRDSEFREKMLGALKGQISKIMTDERQQLDALNQLDVLGATSRSPGKKLDTLHSINPLSRGAH